MGKNKDIAVYLTEQFMKESYDKKKKRERAILKVKMTSHAMQRYNQRLKPLGHSIEDVLEDIKKGRGWIRQCGPGRYLLNGKLGHYVVSRDKTVLTMYEYRKKIYTSEEYEQNF